MSISRPKFIYVVAICSFYLFSSSFSSGLIKRSHECRHLFFCLFFKICPIILDGNVDEECEERIIFKFHKLSLKLPLSICFIFCQFQPGVAYKSITYKNTCFNLSSANYRKITFKQNSN